MLLASAQAGQQEINCRDVRWLAAAKGLASGTAIGMDKLGGGCEIRR